MILLTFSLSYTRNAENIYILFADIHHCICFLNDWSHLKLNEKLGYITVYFPVQVDGHKWFVIL